MIEFDFRLDPESPQIGPQFAVAVAFGDAHGFEYLNVASRCRQSDNANLIDCVYKRTRTAIHDGDFGPIDFDHRIVDAESPEGCENMFCRRYGRAVFIAKNGREFCRRNRMEVSGKFTVWLPLGPRAHKYDAGIRLGWMQCHASGSSGMNADAGHCYMALQRRLPTG